MSHSKYAARMAKLSGRIFGEYKTPPVPKDIIKEVHNDPAPRHKWHALHTHNKKNIHLIARLPHDIDPFFVKYYPPHPQIRQLMYTLREYGLYRYEMKHLINFGQSDQSYLLI